MRWKTRWDESEEMLLAQALLSQRRALRQLLRRILISCVSCDVTVRGRGVSVGYNEHYCGALVFTRRSEWQRGRAVCTVKKAFNLERGVGEAIHHKQGKSRRVRGHDTHRGVSCIMKKREKEKQLRLKGEVSLHCDVWMGRHGFFDVLISDGEKKEEQEEREKERKTACGFCSYFPIKESVLCLTLPGNSYR